MTDALLLSPAKPVKPLGHKAYSSIPHVPGSQVGAGDWSIMSEQAETLFAKPTHGHDRVFAREKLDGSCVAVGRLGASIVALIRAGYLAEDSDFEQHHHFARWVQAREAFFRDTLSDGERVAGEWLLFAHGTRYRIDDPDHLFAPFDILFRKHERRLDAELEARFSGSAIRLAGKLSDGRPLTIQAALDALGSQGLRGALDGPEGVVWRLERKGHVGLIAKYVRHGHQPGRFLKSLGHGEHVMNFDPRLF